MPHAQKFFKVFPKKKKKKKKKKKIQQQIKTFEGKMMKLITSLLATIWVIKITNNTVS